MTWILLALSSGFMQSISDVLIKRTSQNFSPQMVACIGTVVALFVIIPIAAYYGLEFQDRYQFVRVTILCAGIGFVASVLYIKSLSEADLSLALPLATLSPVFILVTGPIINNEWPTYLGACGVILSIAGIYSLSFSKRTISIWRPFTELWINRGMRRMLIVAILWAFTAPLEKVAVMASSPLTYLVAIVSLLGLAQLIAIMCSRSSADRLSWPAVKSLAPRGVCTAGILLAMTAAYSLAPVAYIITLKRTSIAWGMVWGIILFREPVGCERVVGTLLTLAGMSLIMLGG